MTTIRISGTPAEFQKKLQELALPTDRIFHFIIHESNGESILTREKDNSPNANSEESLRQMQSEHAARMRRYDQEFANVPRVYGILQVPIPEPLTIDQIKELSEDQP